MAKQKVDIHYLNLAGTSFYQDGLQTAVGGDACDLVPEPDNPHDDDAIAVALKKNAAIIGYIPRGPNAVFKQALAAGFTFVVSVQRVDTVRSTGALWAQIKVKMYVPEV